MKLKRILALAVSLAMVLTMAPAFGLTASAANFGEGATNLSIEFTLNGPSGGYRDIAITDADGVPFTAFVIAAPNDGFFAFDREENYVKDVSFGAKEGSAGGNGGGGNNNENGVKYTSETTKVKIEVVNTPAVDETPASYTVKMSFTDATVADFYRTRTYTGRTVNGISTPEKWEYHQGEAINADNIYNYLKDGVITADEDTYNVMTQTVKFTYEGEEIGEPYTFTAFEGVEFTVPARSGKAADGTVVGWNATTVAVTSAADAIELSEPDVVIKDGEVAHYTFADGTVKDETGNFDGTVTGNALTFANGIANFPGGFGPETSHIELPKELMKYLDGSFTVSMWINQDSSYNNEGASDSGSIAIWEMSDPAPRNFNRLAYTQAGDTVNILERKANVKKVATTHETKDQWALVTTVFDYDDVETIKMYVNGEELSFTTDQSFNKRTPKNVYDELNGNSVVYLGHNVWANASGETEQHKGNPDLKGGMADVRIYNKALTPEEVTALGENVKHEYTVTYKAEDEAELQNAEGQTVTYFTPEGSDVTIEVPAVLETADGAKYVPANGLTTQTVSGDNTEITYVAKPEAVDEVAPVTFIEGNELLLPAAVTLDSSKYTAAVEWNAEDIAKVNDTPATTEPTPVTVNGTVNDFGGGYATTVEVTKLYCTDESLANEPIDSVSKSGGDASAAHKFAQAVAGEASFEFDVVYHVAPGSNDIIALGSSNEAMPSFGSETFSMQGTKNNTNNNPYYQNNDVAFRGKDGAWSDSHFTPVLEETYRVFTTVNAVTGGTYSVKVVDKNGKVVADESELGFRQKGEVKDLDKIYILFNANPDGKTHMTVSNFRVSWINDNYKNIAVEYKTAAEDGEVIAAIPPQLYTVGETVELDAKSAAYNGKIYKFDAVSEEVTAEMKATDTITVVPAEVVPYAAKSVTTTTGNASPWLGYDVVVGDGAVQASNIYDDDNRALATGRFSCYGGVRTIEEVFDLPVLEDGDIAVLHLAVGSVRKNNGGSENGVFRAQLKTNDAVAYTTEVVDDANDNGKLIKDYITADVTALVKAAADDENLTITIDSVGAIGLVSHTQSAWDGTDPGLASYIEVKKGVEVTVEDAAEGALITKNGSAVTGPILASDGDVIRVYKGATTEKGLEKVVANNVVGDTAVVGAEATTVKVFKAEDYELGVALVDGAQVRVGTSSAGSIAEDSGLRFIGTVDKEGTLAGMDNAEIGVKISPKDAPDQSVTIAVDKYQDEDAETIFTAVLTNLKKSNYNRVFTAVPVVTVGGVTVEGETKVERSIFEVAAGILVNSKADTASGLGDYTIDDNVKAVLNTYVNAVGVRFEITKETGAVGEKNYYNFGKEEIVVFDVDMTGGENGVYTYTVVPQGAVKVDVDAFVDAVRINNNNSAVKHGITDVKPYGENGVQFTFTVDNAKAD